jgi:hypothetical protein
VASLINVRPYHQAARSPPIRDRFVIATVTRVGQDDDHRATAREIRKLAKGQPTIRFTNRFLCADGSYKRVRWNAYPEAETGRLYAIARVRSEQPDQPGDYNGLTERAPAVSDGEGVA